MSRSQRVLEALGMNYVSMAIRTLIKFFLTPFLLTYLGPELMGFRSFVRGYLNYFQLTDLGVKGAISALVAKDFQPGAPLRRRLLRTLRAGGQIQLFFPPSLQPHRLYRRRRDRGFAGLPGVVFIRLGPGRPVFRSHSVFPVALANP